MTTKRLTRRDFFFYSGATLAGVTLGELGRRQLARADERAAAWRGAGVERWAVSVCRECQASCGIRARIIDEVPVKLEGNPLCPVSRGRLCAKGQAALEAYADPDRLTGPARRVGPHGSGKWERITWNEATTLLAARIRSLAFRPGAILAVAAEEHGPVADVWTRVWQAAGARLHTIPASSAARLREHLASLTGADADPHFDFERATYVLSFGAPLAEDWLSPVWTQRSYGRFRRSSRQSRGRLVQIEDRRSMTARKADEWIVTRPGSEVVLAYGMMAVLFRENRLNRAAIEPIAGNMAELERTVVTRFTPDEVAAATGVPVVTILRLARELVATERPVVLLDTGADVELARAVFALNAIVGAVDRPGGIFAALPPLYSSATDIGSAATPSDAAPRMVMLRDSAVFRSLAMPAGFEAALAGAEFVVSFSPYLDESASVADLLLPVHTALESWHAVVPAPSVPGQMLAVAKPAVAPRLETGDLVAVLRSVAAAVGDPVAAACPQASSEQLIGDALSGLATLRRGNPYATVYEMEWFRQLERGGWWTPAVTSADMLPAAVLAAGGWADPFFDSGQIRGTLRERSGFTFASPPPLVQAGALTVHSGAGGYPLRLLTFTPAAVSRLGGSNQPALYEVLGQPEAAPWGTWVEIGSETAREARISTGMRVRVESATGGLDASAVVVEGLPAGVAAVAFVPATERGGRWARLIARDVRVLGAAEALQSGSVAVRVRPV